jgi:hypothetical protein
MKFSWMRAAARYARRHSFVSAAALLLTGLPSAPASVQARTTPPRDTYAAADLPASPHFAARVFVVYGTAKCKVVFTRGASAVTVRLKNQSGQVLHEEVVTAPSYSRRFDLSALPDARYFFELQTPEERYVRAIQLDTHASRTLAVR